MRKTKADFDCVDMMHEAASRIYEETKDMSEQEELAYWRQKNAEARKNHPRLKSLDESRSNALSRL